MAGRGPAPKPDAERRRRNTPPADTRTVAADGALRGPDLPEGIDWPDATLRWWDTWRRSPQAQTFTDTDWLFLVDTAVLHAEFWLGDRGVGSELRLRVAKFGATPEDRMRLRLQVDQDGAGTAPARPTTAARRTAATRKDRLLTAVRDDTVAG